MSVVDDFLAGAPAGATEMRIVSYRVRPSTTQSVGSWLADELMGAGGEVSDAPRPLRIGLLEWLSADGGARQLTVPDDQTVDRDDLARLLVDARRRAVRVSMWSERDSAFGGGSMEAGSTFFAGAMPPLPHPAVTSDVVDGGVRVQAAVTTPPSRWWLIMYPVLIVTFAWVFFLFVGGLGTMIRRIWREGVTGSRSTLDASVVGDRLTMTVTMSGEPVEEVDTAGVVAIGHGGTVAYTTSGAVDLPRVQAIDSATTAAIGTDVASRLNRALGA